MDFHLACGSASPQIHTQSMDNREAVTSRVNRSYKNGKESGCRVVERSRDCEGQEEEGLSIIQELIEIQHGEIEPERREV